MRSRASLAALFLLPICARAGAPAAPSDIVTLSASSIAVLGQPLAVAAAARLAPGESLALDLKLSATDYFAITSVREAAPDAKTSPDGARHGGPPGYAAPDAQTSPDGAPHGGKKFIIQCIPLDIGRRPLPIYWTLTAGASSRTVLSVLPLETREPPEAAGAKELRDIKPPRRAQPRIWPWLLAAALLGAAGCAYRRWRRHGRDPAAAAAAEDARPPEAIAEEELARLEDSGLWAAGRHKQFYGALTEILRRYLEHRFAFPATRQTTWELLRRLRGLDLDRSLLSLFKELFDRSDLVKFAKAPVQEPWGARDLETARRLVHDTTPRPAEPSPRPTGTAPFRESSSPPQPAEHFPRPTGTAPFRESSSP
ncbi:MAG: hypothetical protein WC881_09805, partial [Elusimicrobiota bacterium]